MRRRQPTLAGDRVRVDWGRYGVVREPDDDDQDDERVRVEVQDVVGATATLRRRVYSAGPHRALRGTRARVRVAVGDVNQLADLPSSPHRGGPRASTPTAPCWCAPRQARARRSC